MPETQSGIDLASQTGQESIKNAIRNFSNDIVSTLSNVINNNFIESSIKSLVNLGSDWTGNDPYTQIININNIPISSNTKIDLQPDASVINQLINDGIKAIYIQNNNGVLTAYSIGGYPSTPLSIQCTISNTNKFLNDISIDTLPSKTTYDVDEELDLTDLVIIATYSDGSTENVTSRCVFNPSDGSILSSVGDTNILIAYSKDGLIKTTFFAVTVSAPE